MIRGPGVRALFGLVSAGVGALLALWVSSRFAGAGPSAAISGAQAATLTLAISTCKDLGLLAYEATRRRSEWALFAKFLVEMNNALADPRSSDQLIPYDTFARIAAKPEIVERLAHPRIGPRFEAVASKLKSYASNAEFYADLVAVDADALRDEVGKLSSALGNSR
jgi:hypothetical protein